MHQILQQQSALNREGRKKKKIMQLHNLYAAQNALTWAYAPS